MLIYIFGVTKGMKPIWSNYSIYMKLSATWIWYWYEVPVRGGQIVVWVEQVGGSSKRLGAALLKVFPVFSSPPNWHVTVTAPLGPRLPERGHCHHSRFQSANCTLFLSLVVFTWKPNFILGHFVKELFTGLSPHFRWAVLTLLFAELRIIYIVRR